MLTAAALASAFALSGFYPSASEPQGGEILTGAFPGQARPGYIYLPPNFDPTRRYPVVYLLHGLPGEPSELVDGAQLGEFADGAIAAGTIRPFIAVMPVAGNDSHYDGEWAGPWEDTLVGDVVPWVDANLPTVASRSGRIIAGLSAGGYGAINIALRHPDLFGTAESWSGYFAPLRDGPFIHASTATLDANDPVKLVRKGVSTFRSSGLRFFVSTGPAHSHLVKPASTIAFGRELRELGLPYKLMSYSSAKGQWRAQLEAGLDWALTP